MKNNTKRTIDLIELAGGEKKAADACGVTRQSMWAWKDIPDRHKSKFKRIIVTRLGKLNKLFNKYY